MKGLVVDQFFQNPLVKMAKIALCKPMGSVSGPIPWAYRRDQVHGPTDGTKSMSLQTGPSPWAYRRDQVHGLTEGTRSMSLQTGPSPWAYIRDQVHGLTEEVYLLFSERKRSPAIKNLYLH